MGTPTDPCGASLKDTCAGFGIPVTKWRSVRAWCEHAFVKQMGPNQKGAVAEIAIANEAAGLGLGVYWPLVEHGRCDLVLDLGSRLLRTQCKWGRLRDEVVIVNLATSRHTPLSGYVRSKYTASEVDAIAAYAGELDRFFLIPIKEAEGRSAFYLRLSPARNNQQASVNFAADYEFSGAVVQLARTSHWQCGGRRFESDQLHSEVSSVGAEEFGAHAPRYVQRASQGESFLVTRRGTPMARLVPVGEDALDGDLAQPPLYEEPTDADAT